MLSAIEFNLQKDDLLRELKGNKLAYKRLPLSPIRYAGG